MKEKKSNKIPLPDNIEMPVEEDVEMSSEEMRSDLESEHKRVLDKKAELDSNKVIGEVELKEMKTQIIKEMFSALESVGVDPNDLESISEFLQKLYEQDPDLYELFNAAFNGLMGEEEIGVAPDAGEESMPGGPGGPMPGGPGGPMPGGPGGPMPGGPMPGGPMPPGPGGPMPPGPSGPMPPGPEEEGGGGLMSKFGNLRDQTFRQ